MSFEYDLEIEEEDYLDSSIVVDPERPANFSKKVSVELDVLVPGAAVVHQLVEKVLEEYRGRSGYAAILRKKVDEALTERMSSWIDELMEEKVYSVGFAADATPSTVKEYALRLASQYMGAMVSRTDGRTVNETSYPMRDATTRLHYVTEQIVRKTVDEKFQEWGKEVRREVEKMVKEMLDEKMKSMTSTTAAGAVATLLGKG